MSDHISADSLEWAITHINKYNDTDIFPRAFEIDAIRADWPNIRNHLATLDFAKYKTETAFRILVPKTSLGFRVAVQPGPLESILYAAAVREAADAIENHRVAASSRIACSFRVNLKPDGSFFEEVDGATDYHMHSKELANSGTYTHILTADIADFYNQIYTHRVQSALEAAGIDKERAENLEEFILKQAAKQSRGIPVGPSASNLLAEGCLDDVDKHLMARGFTHTRYVDDFRIFVESPRQAIAALCDLTDYLYTAHRLTLQLSKVRIMTVDEFIGKELDDPKEQEERSKKERIAELLQQLQETIGYDSDIDMLDLDDSKMNKLARDNIVDLFGECIRARPLSQRVARYLLRRARRSRMRALYPLVFDNLESLVPVFRDVALYIKDTMSAEQAAASGSKILKFLRESDYGFLPFVRLWSLYLLEEIPSLASPKEAFKLAVDSEKSLGLRQTALIARTQNKIDWIRGHKETWRNHGPRDRRALIWAATALPPSERNPWLELVKEGGDLLDITVANYVKSLPR